MLLLNSWWECVRAVKGKNSAWSNMKLQELKIKVFLPITRIY